jgi:hypothetical protein
MTVIRYSLFSADESCGRRADWYPNTDHWVRVALGIYTQAPLRFLLVPIIGISPVCVARCRTIRYLLDGPCNVIIYLVCKLCHIKTS